MLSSTIRDFLKKTGDFYPFIIFEFDLQTFLSWGNIRESQSLSEFVKEPQKCWQTYSLNLAVYRFICQVNLFFTDKLSHEAGCVF